MVEVLTYRRDIIGLKSCIVNALANTIEEVLGIPSSEIREYFIEQRLKIMKTPDPKLGDLGIPLHFILHKTGVERDKWIEIGRRLVEGITSEKYIRECYISRAEFINGYLNIWINYKDLLGKLIKDIIGGELDKTLRGIGGGIRVIVEHTSANPVHPLHIGSGRNAVIGSIYANLLRRLGYSVNERFYVDDMGRQVAIMIYGYKQLKEEGVNPPSNVKIDHWFGAVYALTNILIEKMRIIDELNNLEKEFLNELDKLSIQIRGEYGKLKDPNLLQLLTIIDNLKSKKRYIHRYDEELTRIKRILNKLRGKNSAHRDILEYVKRIEMYSEKYSELINELNQYSESEGKLSIVFPEIYRVLSRKITDPYRAEREIDELMYRYENGDEHVAGLFREATRMVLDGFRETLKRINVEFDGYDWESDRRILEYTRMVIDRVSRLPYTTINGKAVIVDLNRAASEHRFIKELFGDEEPGKLVLRRSDGTTLYVTRDIAYSIYKFRDLGAEKTYNVIAHEQDREQKQVRAILYLLGYHDIAENLIHFQYEMVHLKGRSMSGRRGVYYTLDELFEDYIRTTILDYIDTQLRIGGRGFDYELLRDKASKLAVTNIRILLAGIDPRKILVFEPDRLREYLTGSWITYTFVRLQGILRKYYGLEPLDNLEEIAGKTPELYDGIGDVELSIEERMILEKLSEYGETLVKAADYMEPNKLVEYLSNLSMLLNRFYEKYPVIGEKDSSKRSLRLLIVLLSLFVMYDLFKVMKLPVIKRI